MKKKQKTNKNKQIKNQKIPPPVYPSENVAFILHDCYLVTSILEKDLKNGKMPNL